MNAFILLITSTLVVMADFTIAPILPKIQAEYASTPYIELLVKFVLTIPALFIVISSPYIGHLADKFGRKPIVLAGILVYSLSGAFGYFSTNIYNLLISRAIFGIAISAVITGCSAIITDLYKGLELSRMMGLQSSFIGYSGICYVIIGGIMGDLYWRNTFLVYLFPLVLLILFAKYIVEPVKVQKQQNIPSNFDIKKYVNIYLAAFVLMIFFYMIPLQIPFYLKSIEPQINNTTIALTLTLVSFFSATISIFFKHLKGILSFKTLYIFPLIIMGLGYITVTFSPNYANSVAGLVLTGAAMGLLVPNLRVWTGSLSDITNSGRTFGGLTACFYLGQVFSPIFINMISGNFTLAGIIMVIIAATVFFISSNNHNRSTNS